MAKAEQKEHFDIDQATTDRILAIIEKSGSLPWTRGWDAAKDSPVNLVTGASYRGANTFILFFEQIDKGYELPYWLTVKQARIKWGCAVCKKADKMPYNCATGECPMPRKGEKATVGVFYKPWFQEDKETGEKVFKRTFATAFWVFNVAQFIEGRVPVPNSSERVFVPVLECEEIGLKMEKGVKIDHIAQSKAFYRPSEDRIVLPLREQFHSTAEYYSTRYHEMVHSTGHESRLNRATLKDAVAFGDVSYCEEELVAELGAPMLCARTGIANEASERNSAAYVKGWGSKLKEDKKMFLNAARGAQRAVSYIMGEKYTEKEE